MACYLVRLFPFLAAVVCFVGGVVWVLLLLSSV